MQNRKRFGRVATALAIPLLLTVGLAAPAGAARDTYIGTTATNSRPKQITIRKDTLAEVNKMRSRKRKCGSTTYPAAPRLALDQALNNSAYLHSKDMAKTNQLSHYSKKYGGSAERATAAGYKWSALGENIAAGYYSVEEVIAGWMDSPGHCANIMDPNFTDLGVGAYYRSGTSYGTFWTIQLGRGKSAGVKDVLLNRVSAATPKITGTARVGRVLEAKPGNWSSKATLTYQWLRGGKAIKGATGKKYKLVSADKGKRISVKVTGKRSGYASSSKTSKKTDCVLGAKVLGSRPTITGTKKVGKTLMAKAGTWTKGSKISYQWYANGSRIKGATKSKLKLTRPLKGKCITVKVTGKKTGYVKTVKTSKKTVRVT